MERGKSEFQSWLQTAAVIATIIATVGFFWLNVPSKDDIKLLRDDLKSEMQTGFKRMSGEISTLRSEVDAEVAGIKTDVRTNAQNHVSHLAKHNEKDAE